MTAENPNAPEPPKAAGSVDSFHPAKVRETTRQFGIAAITYVVISTFIELWPLLTGGSSEVFDGCTERDVAISFAAFATVLAIWLGVEIYVSQRRWAALVTFLLCLLDTVASGLQVFEPGGLPRYWAPLTLCSVGATYAAFVAVKGSRLIAAGKVSDEAPPVAEAPSSISEAMQISWRETKGMRSTIRFIGAGSILVTLAVGAFIWNKAERLNDGVAAPTPPVVAQEASAPRAAPAASPEPTTTAPTSEVQTLVAEVRELCSLQGTDDQPVTWAALVEMADVKIAGFDRAKAKGFAMSPADVECYRSAQETLRAAQQEALGQDEEAVSEESAGQ